MRAELQKRYDEAAPTWYWNGEAPPFAVGSAVIHPVHGVLTVVAITRRVPTSVEGSNGPLDPIRVAMVTRDRLPHEIYLDEATGAVSLRPTDLTLVLEDVYLLEAPAMALYVRVADAVAWGARPYFR